ncbi:InlB B-repeat-containing protein [Treponema vincentii]|uniref:InlB B-repeat-containing protein n=1 Tax=Treponema vincentii TaxID=69710 RepID=UPI001E46A6AC|nr:InlB B-repeat-containing protein [Treponema vincentii]
MKMRNMLRGILLLLLMASGLSVFLSCKGLNPTPTPYTVTFDAQGGSTVAPINAAQGKTIAKPADPVRASFTFGGWYKESACTTPWNFATDTVTADITLYAKWTPVVTVMFTVSDGTGGTLTAKADGKELKSGAQVKKGTDVTFTAAADPGYAVESLSVNGETKSDTSITVKADKDLTVTVKFKAADTVTYTVTFDAQGGSAVAPIQAGQGKTIAQPADPAKDGFTFGGWYKESACTTPWNFATDTVTADITLYAKWTAVAPATVTVTFAVKGGHGTLTAKAGDTNLTSGASVKKGTDVTFTAAADPGYEIDYILINEEKKTEPEITVKADKDITATVKFKAQSAPATELCTVHYNASPAAGGLISAKDTNGTPVSSEKKIEKGTVLEFTAVPNTGYDISGWTGATAASDNKTATLTVTQDSTVTVTFTLKKYTVNFDTQGGTAVTPLEVEHGKTVQKPADPVKASFTFGGWYKENTCTTPWNFATDTVTAEITLYAQWKITIQFAPSKMTCRKNGGGDINPGDTVHENDELFFTATLSTGQTVDKWTVNDVDQGGQSSPSFHYKVKTADAPSGSIKVDCAIKTVAHGTIQFAPSKMTCSKDGGDDITTGTTVYENDVLNFTATPPSGQTVGKWSVNNVEKDYATQPEFSYTVRADDVQGGAINIDYTPRTAAHGTIQFDPSKMKCRNQRTYTFVNTGDTVYENDVLDFAATPPAGQTVNKWTVNGVEKDYATQPWFTYTVKAEDVQGGVINIDYTPRTAAQAVIHFDSRKMKCWKNIVLYTNTGTPVTDGATVYEKMKSSYLSLNLLPERWPIHGR